MVEFWPLSPGAVFLVALTLFFIGYASGRRFGKREGFAEGVRFSPLEMRRKTWDQGHCVICGGSPLTPCHEEREIPGLIE